MEKTAKWRFRCVRLLVRQTGIELSCTVAKFYSRVSCGLNRPLGRPIEQVTRTSTNGFACTACLQGDRANHSAAEGDARCQARASSSTTATRIPVSFHSIAYAIHQIHVVVPQNVD